MSAAGGEATSAVERCRRLLAEVETRRQLDPLRAVAVAREARDLAATVPVAELGAGGRGAWLALQCDAWGVLASAERAAGDWARAEEALVVALAFADDADWDESAAPRARPRLAQRAAYLRRDQGRFAEAMRLLDDAAAGYRRLRDERWLAAVDVDRGQVLGRAGELAAAVVILADAVPRLDPLASPRNYLAAVHAVALYLDELAESDPTLSAEALAWLDLAVRLHRQDPARPKDDALPRLRLRMLEARAALRLGDREAGIAELWRVHDALRDLGADYDQLFALVYLATAHLGRDRRRRWERLAGQLFPLLRRLRQPPELAAALLRLATAMRRGEVDAALLAEIRRLLGRAPWRQLPTGT